MRAILYTTLLLMFVCHSPVVAQIDIESPPIRYSETEDANSVRELIRKLDSGETRLDYEPVHGYLRSILKELDVPTESQVLVFSKTSMQVQHISRRNPRAIYFNDDCYVAWIRGSSLMEISTSDPNLGAAFYSVRMYPGKPAIARENYNCLACHISSMTQGIPGHTVRSVYPDFDGTIDSRKRSFVTDHSSPFSERWGGWYVTGQHGDMRHMGNAVLRSSQLDTARSANLESLRDEFDTRDWPRPYSDIVALMVLEHQTQMHNHFTRASFTIRRAVHEFQTAHAEDLLSAAATAEQQELKYLISQQAKEVVDYMLFCDETQLTSAVQGTASFADVFQSRPPHDEQGRSLRELDLQSRLFKYPCSYLIYSAAFDGLPEALRNEVVHQLVEVLEGRKLSAEYEHLTGGMRAEILEILRGTKPEIFSSEE